MADNELREWRRPSGTKDPGVQVMMTARQNGKSVAALIQHAFLSGIDAAQHVPAHEEPDTRAMLAQYMKRIGL